MIVEIIVSVLAGLFLGSFLEKKFIEFRLDSFELTLKNSKHSIIKTLEDSQEPESHKLKRVKNHLNYLESEFRRAKNLD